MQRRVTSVNKVVYRPDGSVRDINGKMIYYIDEYSVYALSSISGDNVLIEFENAVSYRAGERVWAVGSSELSEIS